ncbi:N-acetylmuramoyl-L-alanine amidase [Paenibacillus sp. GYB004]|uniref:N-acetylmuramoyl-L-alanine amidase n=1 Tax=Paenibacillus sp. GYB004 TaxID=2994393 RepID=UPI003FA7AFEF
MFNLTLDISKRIVNILKAHGIDAHLTRESDKFVELSTRTSWTNKQGAAGLNALHGRFNLLQTASVFSLYNMCG